MKKKTDAVASHSFMVKIKVIVSASRNIIAGFYAGELIIKLCAQPEKGKANRELVSFLARELKIPKNRVTIVRGETSHHKIVAFPVESREKIESIKQAHKKN